MDHILGTVLHHLIRALEWHLLGDFLLDLFLDRRGFTLGCLDHDLLTGAHHLTGAGQHPLLSVLFNPLEIVQPLVLPPHAVKPVPTVADAEVAHNAFNPRVEGPHQNGITAACPSRAKCSDTVGIHIGPCL